MNVAEGAPSNSKRGLSIEYDDDDDDDDDDGFNTNVSPAFI
jgi:hypothetical protein